MFICRLIDTLPGRTGDYFPSMAFPIILLSLTFWLCFFGWLSLLEVYGAVPWVLVLFVWVGVLGVAGLTDNHIVWSGPLSGEPSAWGGVRMLIIRNESDPGAATAKDCGEVTQPTRAQVIPVADNACTTPIGDRYRPARPLCARGKTPYLDLFEPLLAVINTSGIGASGRLAEAREGEAIVQARLAMGGKAAASKTEPVTAVDLLPKGVHFPLGWHLSRAAVDNMKEQAARCSLVP